MALRLSSEDLVTTQAPESYREVPVQQRRSVVQARYGSVVLGLWLAASAFAWEHYSASQTNTWAVGVLIAAAALIAPRNRSMRWVTPALAIWLAASTLLFWPVSTATLWNNMIVAALVFALSLVSTTPHGAAGAP